MFKYFKAHFSVNLYQPLSKTAQKEKNMINATNRAKEQKSSKPNTRYFYQNYF